MPRSLILADWLIAIVIGVPSALFFIGVGGFYLFRPKDAQLAGIAGYAALFVALSGLMLAGLFALAAWGAARDAQWAIYVQVIALLSALLPAQMIRNAIKVKKRDRREYEELKKERT